MGSGKTACRESFQPTVKAMTRELLESVTAQVICLLENIKFGRQNNSLQLPNSMCL
jgi:hypothetical protein